MEVEIGVGEILPVVEELRVLRVRVEVNREEVGCFGFRYASLLPSSPNVKFNSKALTETVCSIDEIGDPFFPSSF